MKSTNLIIGKANTGKTRCILFNETKKFIENNENIFIMDSREEYYETFGQELKDKGYNVLVLNLNDSTKSNGYNPFILPYKLYKEGKKDAAIEMIHNFAYEMCKEKNQIDPFWTNSAADYVTGLILIMFKNAKEEEINLGSLTMMINQAEIECKNSTILNTYLSNISLLDNSYISMSGTAFAPYETRASILSVVKQKLNAIVMKENLLNLLSTNDIDLNEINTKTAIFAIGKSDIANIILNQLYYIVKTKKISFNFIIEEVNNYTKISSLKELIEDATYNNLKVYISTRNNSEFKKCYGEGIEKQFENIIETNNENKEIIGVGDFDQYPNLEQKNHNYFNFKDFVETNM